MQQRVRIPHRGRMSFVCQTTPHFGSTSRRVPTLFVLIIHDQEEKVNTQNDIHAFFDSDGGTDAKSVGLFPGFRGRIRGFSLPGNVTMDFTMNEGGRAMQCQKLKTYMETGRVVFLPARAIKPNPAQPRRIFREEALTELAESIRQHGILQPLSVRRVGTSYELIAGERRLRAAQMAGLTEIPCIVMSMDDKESGMAALVENLQRQDLDFIEEALGISRLLDQWAMSQEQIARILGKSQSAVANKLRILRHSPQVLNAIREGGLTERHARALLKLSTDAEKLSAIAVIVQCGMSVARAESYIDSRLAEKTPKQPKANVGAFLNNLNQSLARIQLSGIPAVSERRETDKQIVLTITIPKP